LPADRKVDKDGAGETGVRRRFTFVKGFDQKGQRRFMVIGGETPLRREEKGFGGVCGKRYLTVERTVFGRAINAQGPEA